jgi:putative tricarboxylic transport membrane protein
MKTSNSILGILIIGFSVIGFVYVQSTDIQSLVGLSPGAFPQFLFILFALCGLVIFREPDSEKPSDNSPFEWKNTVKILLAFTAYVFGFEYGGFLASTVVFLIIAMYVFNERRMKILLTVPLLTSVCIYFLFTELFLIPLP